MRSSCVTIILLAFILLLVCSMTSATVSIRSKSVLKQKGLHANTKRNGLTIATGPNRNELVTTRAWLCGDSLDRRILALAVPAMINFIIFPIVGAIDTYWVGQLHITIALAGHSAAAQVYTSCNWVISFFPAVMTPLVAKAYGSKNMDSVQERVGEALLIAFLIGIVGTATIGLFPNLVLNMILKDNSKVQPFALPYLRTRALCVLPSLLSTVAFSTFRGTFDVVEPLKISILMSILNAILDPLCIFSANQGVVGVASAKLFSELIAVALYMRALSSRKLVNWSRIFRLPSFSSLYPLLSGGLTIQMRSIVLNFAYMSLARCVQQLDESGTAAAAHAIVMQIWQVGLFSLIALGTVASIMVPGEVAKTRNQMNSDVSVESVDREAALAGRVVANRLLCWGVTLGAVLGGLQIVSLPLLKWFTTNEAVLEAAVRPSLIGAVVQIVNGLVVVGESIQQGNQGYTSLTVSTALSTLVMLASLRVFGRTLDGVWISTLVLNVCRLMGVLVHHFITGPLATKQDNSSIKVDSLNVSDKKKK